MVVRRLTYLSRKGALSTELSIEAAHEMVVSEDGALQNFRLRCRSVCGLLKDCRERSTMKKYYIIHTAAALLAAVCCLARAAYAEVYATDNPEIPEVCDCSLPDMPGDDQISLYEDIVYNSFREEQLLLDLAVPAGDSQQLRPLVILFHGGGFAAGDKAEGGGAAVRRAARQLAGLGYAAISANYRLSRPDENHFPAAVQDARCAVRFIEKMNIHGLIQGSRDV